MIRDLDQFKGQFFYWYYTERLSMREVTKNFDQLFDEVFRVTGIRLEVTYV